MLQRAGAVSRTATSMRLTRTGFFRTSITTLPSSVSSTIGYHAPRRRTSATLSKHRTQPRGEWGGDMSRANLAYPARFRYAHDRYHHATADSARLAQNGRESYADVRPDSPA